MAFLRLDRKNGDNHNKSDYNKNIRIHFTFKSSGDVTERIKKNGKEGQ